MKRYSKYALIPIIIASLVFVNYLTPHQSSAANTTHTFPSDTAFNAAGYSNDSGNVTVSGTEISLAQDEAWGHSGLTYKKQLTVTNPTADTLHSGTTLTLNLDTSALINATKLQADGDDLRVYYQPDASTKKELMRTLTPASGATLTTSTQTLVSFQLQDDILTTTSNTYYYLYYGNSSLDYFNKAQSFDGGDYIRVPYNASLVSNTMTVGFWAKSNTASYAANADLVSEFKTSGNCRQWRIYVSSTNQHIYITTSDDGTNATTHDTGTVIDTLWHRYDFVVNNTTREWNYYRDGALVQTISVARSYTDLNSTLTIGGLEGSNFFNGLIEDVKISNNLTDVPTLWNSGTYNKPLEVDANTVALYHLNDVGQTIEDASSNNNDGTKGATSDPSTDDPTTVDSTVNVARSYPGASFVAPMNGSQTGMEGEAATYTRNSVGTYIDDAGKIQEVTANNPRYEKRSGTLQNGLVGHWKMNEASWSSVAGEVIDSSGTGYNGRSYSSANTTTGKLDRAGEMVGDTSRVDIGDVPYLNNVPAFTYSAWLKQDVVPAGGFFFYKAKSDANADIQFLANSNNTMTFHLGNGGNTQASLSNYSAYVTAGQWFHITVVYDGTQATDDTKFKVYINNSQRSLTFPGGAMPSTTYNLAGYSLRLGCTVSSWDGSMDDVRVYNRAINATEVGYLYNSGSGVEDYNNTPPRSTVIEEARTNYILNSSFETDTDADGLADNWGNANSGLATNSTRTITTDYMHGTKSQRIQYTGQAGDVNASSGDYFQNAVTAVGSFAAGENATFSVWMKGRISGLTATMQLVARDAGGGLINIANLSISGVTGNWQKYQIAYNDLPVNTSRVTMKIILSGVDSGDTLDLYLDAAQIEKGKFATSYIPTTTATVARSSDSLSYPTAGNLDYNAGTVSMWVKNEWDGDDSGWHAYFNSYVGATQNRITVYKHSTNRLFIYTYSATDTAYKAYYYDVNSTNFAKNTWYNIAASWTKSGAVALYLNGVSVGVYSAGGVWADISAIGSNFYIGTDGHYSNSNISDFRIYNSVLSDNAVKDIYNATSSTYGYGSESVARYQNSGTYTSPVVDLTNNAGWQSGENFVPTQALNSGTVTYQTRVGDNGYPDPVASPTHWSSWSAVSGNAIQSSGYPGKRYLQWKALLAPPADQSNTPTISNLVVNYTTDSTAPTNPTDTDGWKTSSKTSGEELTSGNYSNSPNPYFEWSGQTDDQNLYGYYVYFGTEVDAEPFTAGTLQTTANYTSNLELVTGTTYYLRVRAVDRAGNTYTNADTSAYTLFTYQYDGTAPTQPEYANVSPAGCSTNSNFTFTWPAVTDSVSGLASYEYKKGSTGTVHTTTDTSVTLTPYQDGDNVFYVRTKDNAGSVSPWTTAIFCSTGIAHLVDGPTVEAGPSSIIVNWTSSKATTSYVKVYQGNTYVSEQGHLDYSTTHNVKVLGLKPEQSYRYQIAWLDSDGNAGESDWFNTSTPVTPRVVGLRSQILSPTSVVVSYTTNYSASTAIKYGVGGYSTEIPMAGVGTTFSQQIDGLTGGTTYQIAIDALTDDGSNFSIGDAFTTPPLPAISNLRFEPIADRASSSIKVTWLTNVETTSSIFFSPKGEKKLEKTTVEKVKDHEIEITDLNDNANYEIYAYGIDQYGNTTTSSINTYSTPFDTRAPKISNITIETSNVGLGQKDKAQMAVSWKTDEATTSQVEYAEGVSGTEYTSKTQEDPTLTNSHLVIISDLTPGKPYHLRVVSKDKGGNTTNSEDNTVIAGEVPKSTLQLILKVLNNTFGWLGRLL